MDPRKRERPGRTTAPDDIVPLHEDETLDGGDVLPGSELPLRKRPPTCRRFGHPGAEDNGRRPRKHADQVRMEGFAVPAASLVLRRFAN